MNTFKKIGFGKQYRLISFCISLLVGTTSFADLIYPDNLQTQRGTAKLESLGALKIQDQADNANEPNKYLEFIPAKKGYNGIFRFNVYSGARNKLKSLVVRANYRGQNKSSQKWFFKLLDVRSGKWVTVADNAKTAAWRWTTISKIIKGDLTRFVSRNSQIKLQYMTEKNKSTSQLDYLALVTPISKNNSRTHWQPAIGTPWQIQYTGNINTTLNVDAFNLDLFDTSTATITGLHAKGKHVICYFSAGSYENWRPDAGSFPAAVLGRDLDGWPGEKWLDVRKVNTLIPIMKARMQMAASKGCDAVDPDNVDGYSNNTGFALSGNDQLAYNIALAQEAHKLGLAISLKNDLAQIKDLVAYFDFAVNEECFQFNECGMLKPFIAAGKPVFGIEYNLSAASFCPQANSMNMDFLKKNLSLDAARTACR
jgi:hypothetical protein